MKTNGLLFTILILMLTACVPYEHVSHSNHMEDYFYVRKSQSKHLNKDWVIILPGYSGLKVFDDYEHYFLVADELNAAGFDVIVVDYKPAYQASRTKVIGPLGIRIKWITQNCISWAMENGHIDASQKGHVASWSVAGEGMILLANDSVTTKELNISSMSLFYPSNRDSTVFQSKLPILVQTGEIDKLTKVNSIRKTYGNHSNVQFIVYPEAEHGFDVAGLKEPHSLRLPPLFGKKIIFQYEEKAATQSHQKMIEFFRQH